VLLRDAVVMIGPAIESRMESGGKGL
jgi:hypothetical protein